MIGLIQRVTQASVEVKGQSIGRIQTGILLLLGVEQGDSSGAAKKLIDKVLAYRVFADAEGKMNLNLAQVAGGLLIVPQFTLAANTQKGLRPSFASAAPPEVGKELFNCALDYAKSQHGNIAYGEFGADMQVHLVNDGPVTFHLQVN